MIECVDEKIWYTRKNKKKSSKTKKIIIFILIIGLLFSYYYFFIVKNVCNFCQDELGAISTNCINNTVFLSTEEKVNYQDIVTIDKNANGDIILIESNSRVINSISSSLAVLAKKNLEKELIKGVKIPFFVFVGLNVFSGYGKKVSFKTLEVSKVTCDIKGKFESAGINQTLHTIYVDIKTIIRVFMPFQKSEISNTTRVILCESVIVGRIPDVYLNKG